jgi:hypothetical protein
MGGLRAYDGPNSGRVRSCDVPRCFQGRLVRGVEVPQSSNEARAVRRGEAGGEELVLGDERSGADALAKRGHSSAWTVPVVAWYATHGPTRRWVK